MKVREVPCAVELLTLVFEYADAIEEI